MVAKVVLGEAGWLAPGQWRWARALVWLAALAVMCIMSFNLAADATLRLSALAAGEVFTSRGEAPTEARLLAVIIGSIAMLAVYALTVSFVERRRVSELGLGRLLPELLVGLAIGGVLVASTIGVMWSAGWVAIAGTPITQLLESVKESVQSGVIEEVLMRLIIFRLLWRIMGVFPALILTAALFGGLHLLNPDATLFAALCLVAGEGVGIGLYLLTGRIWMSIGMHAGWNFVQGWVFGSAVSGFSDFVGGPLQTTPVEGVAPILSGGGFGPESTLAALVISLLASLIFLGVAWKKGRFVAAG